MVEFRNAYKIFGLKTWREMQT